MSDDSPPDKKIRRKTKFYCGNCGKFGHLYKYCNEPITSFGVILISISSDDSTIIQELLTLLKHSSKPQTGASTAILYDTISDIELFGRYKNNIKFLLIRRKHTLGFIEFIRGRYNVENIDGIIFLFKQMTPDEINKISTCTFDQLWNDLWSNNKLKLTYQTEYTQAKYKFEKLKEESEHYLTLDFYTDNIIPAWNYAEWGFPKGRRNFQEDNMSCAIREFQEESGFSDDEFILLNNIAPLEEQFIGTNGVKYKHIYYVAISSTDKLPTVNPDNRSQTSEIGAISWFTFDEAIKLLRPYHTERRRILTELYMYILNNIIVIRTSKIK